MGKQAFEGPRSQVFHLDPADIVIIGLDTDDGPEHPLWDSRIDLPVVEETVHNMMAHGVLEPITVRKNGDVAEVIYGRQRVKHAREANRRLKKLGRKAIRVECKVRRGDADGKLVALGFSENHHRRDDTPLNQAKQAKRLLDMGYVEEEILAELSVSRPTFRRWMKLLELTAPVQRMVDSGKLSSVAAAKLADLPREEQEEKAKELVEAGAGTAAGAAAHARAKKTGGPVVQAPPRRVLRKVVAANAEYEEPPLDPEFIKGVRWAMGDLDARSIAGLRGLIED